MRVLVFTTVFPNPAQPLHGLFVLERVRHAARHAAVRVVAPVAWHRRRPGAAIPRRARCAGLPVEHPSFVYIPGIFKGLDGLFLALSAVRRVARVRRGFDFDLIDAHFAFPEGFAAVLLGRWFGRPVTITLRGTEILLAAHRPRRWALRWALRRADRVIAVAQPLADLARALGVPADRVAVIENGVDTARFNRFMLPDTSKKRVRVGCVANLRAVKNIDGLMRAAKAACERFPQLAFEVAGEGDQRPELERLHADLGLGDRFKLKGSVPEVAAFLRTVEVAVLPSHSEGMSNALLEKMSAGRAVVATDVGANAELVEHGRSGLVVPPGDGAALVEAIGAYLANPLKAAAFGAAARKRVEAEYSRAAMTRRFEDYYHALAGR